jgi:hypothetical protein
MGLKVSKMGFDGIAGNSTYYIVGPDRAGNYRTFNGLLQGGAPFAGLRAHIYALLHS